MELLLYLIKEIVKLLLLCGTTYFISFGMFLVTVAKMFKTFVENGYKINSKRLKEHNQNNSNQLENLIFIPFINIIISMIITVKITQEMNKAFNALDVLGCLDELTPKEIEEYKKSPTVLTAIMINCIDDSYETIEIAISKEIIKNKEDAENLKEIINELLNSDISEEELYKRLNEISQNIQIDIYNLEEENTSHILNTYNHEEISKKFDDEFEKILSENTYIEEKTEEKAKKRTLSKPNNRRKQ